MASGLSHGTSIESMARPVAVDHRISIHYYFRIADNLLRQANVYREEKNVLDLYIILLRYSSLLLETIPKHRDYHAFKAREKEFLKKGPHNSEKILGVVNELESLKPVVQQQIATCNSRGADEPNGVYGTYAASSGLEHQTPDPYMSKSLAGSPTRLLQKPLPGSKHQAATSQSIQPYRHAMKPHMGFQVEKLGTAMCLHNYKRSDTNCSLAYLNYFSILMGCTSIRTIGIAFTIMTAHGSFKTICPHCTSLS